MLGNNGFCKIIRDTKYVLICFYIDIRLNTYIELEKLVKKF